ncbi:MAG: elongation factor P [Candidatus Levybacteria bacterium RIFCSPHIGHO2_01_FULL_36_15]|nr:MAG: elongation factor P [Candidatus Levybacteria bacterium RIFCSPHIGHO2_01_FULL_36_15]
MLSVTSLRSGTTYEEDGNIYEVLSYEHIKMGRGSASVKVKVRNLRSGAVLEKGFISHAVVKDINLEKKEYQYLYKDSNLAYFMDPVSFEQTVIPLKNLEGYQFLKEGESVALRYFGIEPLGVTLPPKVTLTVTETPPGVKGNSASNVYKDATLENGMRVRVPLFINSGDKIIVDTRDGSYTKRA